MKAIALNGSPHQNGNTRHALDIVCAQLEAAGIDTEVVWVGVPEIRSCRGCNMCARNRDGTCILTDDPVNGWISKMAEADGILLGSTVHFSGISSAFKAFLDRAFYVCDNSGHLLRRKVGAAVAAVRRSGGVATADALYHYLAYSEMVLPTSNYWPVIHGLKPGQVEEDAEGVQILGKHRLNASAASGGTFPPKVRCKSLKPQRKANVPGAHL